MKRVIGFLSTAVFFTAGLLVALAGTGAAQPAPLTLDHFYCYFALGQFRTFQVPFLLQDQFDGADHSETVRDLRIVRFCNPVQKTTADGAVTPILHPADHLTMYLITPEPIIPRVVLIKNQFGTQRLRTGNALLLAVPSGKVWPLTGPTQTPPVPTDLDHFKCYLASGRAIGQRVLLKDQFSQDSVLAGVLQPILFCNPVKKTIPNPNPTAGPTITPITNPAAHLACYVTTPRNFQPTPPRVFYDNQFSRDLTALDVSRPDMLCVPSSKLRWVPVPAPSSLVP
jgi:hypothetical protein